MEKAQYDIHSARRELIPLTSHLLTASTELKKAFKRARFVRWFSPEAESIEQNLDTLIKGLDETIKFAGIVADAMTKAMENPNAIIPGRPDGKRMTPMQRILYNEGYIKTLGDLDPKPPPKNILRIPQPLRLSFNTTKRQKNRKSTLDNPPL